MDSDEIVLSICTTCRDGREEEHGTRGGSRLAQRVLAQMSDLAPPQMRLRGVKCMSQCKRPCTVSLAAEGCFTYVFGDLDPNDNNHIGSLFELVSLYSKASEGFLERKDRPEVLQAGILGRLPPLNSQSSLTSDLEVAEA